MQDFSATQAISAGFRLLGRHPLAFLAWTATYLVVCMAPQFGMMALVLPEWSRMMQDISASSGTGHPPVMPTEMFAAQAHMMQLQPVVILSSLIGHCLVVGAIYRAVLFPQDSRFCYLRLSARELWLGLVMLVLWVSMAILTFAVAAVVLIIGGVLATASHAGAAAGILAFPGAILVLAVLVWVMLRLSLSLPMSFAAPGFKFYESWALTRGHAGKMFIVALAFAVMIWVVELVLFAGIVSAAGGFGGIDAMLHWTRKPHVDLSALAPWMVAGGLILGVFATAVATLFGAGWAQIYSELTGGEPLAP